MSKQLLIETAEFITPIKIEKGLKESVSIENNNDILIVKNIPATIADRKNQNGRIYTTEVLQEAIKNANFQLKTKWMYSQADEHPEGSFVAPTHASHVVTNAYIKKNVKVFVEGKTERHNVMFMDWEILNTEEGKNLKALILQETACPTSIRGLGDMDGEYVTDYELLGCDVVSNPSSGTSMRMPVSESVKVSRADKSSIDESFEIVTVSSDVVSDVEAAAQKQVDIENAKYGTITNIKTKLDQEIDPKTHAETTITSIEATTTDEVSQLDQALQMAKNAFVNPVSKMDSVTITFVDDAEKARESTETTSSNLKEEDDDKKEFLDPSINVGDVNVMGGLLKANSNNVDPQEESVNAGLENLIDTIKSAIQDLNNKLIDEKDPEQIKKLKMNRDELEKLLNKNKETQDLEDKKEFLDFGTTEINGDNNVVDVDDVEDLENLNIDSTEDVKEDLSNEIIVDKDKNMVTLPLEKDSELHVNDGKVSVQVDKKTSLDQFYAPTEVSTIKSDNTSNTVSEDSQPNNDGGTDYTCHSATYDYKTGEFTCEDTQNEKLYTTPDAPSDNLVNKPLNDSDDTEVNVVLTNIDYDISDPENITAEDEQYLSELPNEVTVTLAMNTIPQEGEIDNFIIAQAVEQTGLPIKNAKLKSVSVDLLDKPQESVMTEGDNNTFTTYAFLNGQLKDEVSNIVSEEEAIKSAEAFTQQYENQGANFQVIVTKTDSEGFEDFDQLVYQYPTLDIVEQ